MKENAIDLNLPCPTLQSSDDWQSMLQTILEAMECQTGTVHRFDADSQLLSLVTQIGIPAELLDKVGTIPIGKGIAGAAAESREAVQLCNLQTDSSGVARPDAKKTQVAGSLAIPILGADDQLLGTLGVGMFVPHEFSADETELLWSIARWLAPNFT
jgi:signal transduction protein with GAF and PtsI domain